MRTGLILALALLASGDAFACSQEWTKRPIHMGGGLFEFAGCSAEANTEHVCLAVTTEDDELRKPGLPHTGGWVVALSQNFGRTILEWTSPMGHALRRYADLGPCQDGTTTCQSGGWPHALDITFEPDSGFHDVAEPFDQ